MKITTQQVLFSLLMLALFAACSRPVAYFQPSTREQFNTAVSTTSEPVSTIETPASPKTEITTPDVAAAPAGQLAQANATLDQVDALVRNDRKLTTDKTVQKRLSRIRGFLAVTSAKAFMTPATASAPNKANMIERLMLKKINKKINKQLAPANPEKAMISTGTLATGAVLVILGLLLLLLTTGTVQTIGLISLLIGAVVLLIGLL